MQAICMLSLAQLHDSKMWGMWTLTAREKEIVGTKGGREGELTYLHIERYHYNVSRM